MLVVTFMYCCSAKECLCLLAFRTAARVFLRVMVFGVSPPVLKIKIATDRPDRQKMHTSMVVVIGLLLIPMRLRCYHCENL